jgi:hypothetical protein
MLAYVPYMREAELLTAYYHCASNFAMWVLPVCKEMDFVFYFTPIVLLFIEMSRTTLYNATTLTVESLLVGERWTGTRIAM